jgi:integrase
MIGGCAMKFKLPYLRVNRDRKGRPRYYVRRPGGHKAMLIRAKPGTPAFHSAYEAAMGAPKVSPNAANAGTWRWLCAAYLASPEFGELSPATKAARRRILESTWSEPFTPGSNDLFGDCPFKDFSGKHVRVLRDRKRDYPDAANVRVKTIRAVFSWALETEHATINPAVGVAKLKSRNPDGYHTWTVEEVAQYRERHELGSKARLALELLLFTGARRSDVVRLGPPMAQDGWLRWTVAKTKRPIEIPILPQLQAVVDATPLTGLGTWLVTQYGKPFTVAGFGNWFRDRCNEAGLLHCSAHGLRKAGATIAAENGATPHDLMAIFGWESLAQVDGYTRMASRRKLAGEKMRLLVAKDEST